MFPPTQEEKLISLYQEGEVGGFSAMARTVGQTAALAADMILRGEEEELREGCVER